MKPRKILRVILISVSSVIIAHIFGADWMLSSTGIAGIASILTASAYEVSYSQIK